MNIKVKRICEEAKLPTRGSEKAAAYDVYACLPDKNAPVAIMPHQTMLIGTGLRMAPPEGFYVGVYARSGLSSIKKSSRNLLTLVRRGMLFFFFLPATWCTGS